MALAIHTSLENTMKRKVKNRKLTKTYPFSLSQIISSALKYSFPLSYSLALSTFLIVSTSLLVGGVLFSKNSYTNTKDNSPPTSTLSSSCTLELEINGTIGLATLDAYQRARKQVLKKACSSLLLLINTPGGALQTTRLIIEDILNSPFPVLCLVHPSGGHAGSAGAIILQACHVSGALPATNIGAATPILSTGKETPKDLRKKMINDTQSWIEGITQLRKRNQKFSKEIVTQAKAVSATEAAKIGAIDFLVQNKREFLEKAQNRSVILQNNQKAKVLTGDVISFPLDARYKVISLLADPETAYLIFMGSLGLIYFEITHPGTIIPGVLGGIGLIISLMSFHKLNVQWGGLALICLGMILMLAEAFAPSFGFLGLGGIASFVLGSLFLFDPQSGYSLSYPFLVGASIFFGLITFLIAYMAYSTRKIKRSGAFDVLIGKTALIVKVNKNNNKRGLAEVHGETWSVESETPLQIHDEMTVLGFEGLKIKVAKKADLSST